MTAYIIAEGDVQPLTFDAMPPAYTYGQDWIVIDAADAQDALAQADQFAEGLHPAQTEMTLFAIVNRADTDDDDERRVLYLHLTGTTPT